jgi:molybdopterin molybdotransferase
MADAPLTVPEARARMLAAATAVAEGVTLPLDAALGRVLLTDLHVPHPLPPFDDAAMDGYALRFADHAGAPLPHVGVAAAGFPPAQLPAGATLRIFTGAPLPDGADTVVAQEDVTVTPDGVTFPAALRPGTHVRRAGSDLPAGACALPAGVRLRPQDLALAAAAGAATLLVRRAVRVALLTTGDELHPPGVPLPPGGIHDANAPLLRALVTTLGAEVIASAHVRDDLDATTAALGAAAEGADLILTTGGVSVGDADHVRAAVARLGSVDVWRVAVKPGKPLGFGTVAGVPWLGLPGNPVSGLVSFALFVAPFLRALQGRRDLLPRPLRLEAAFDSGAPIAREGYHRVRRDDDARLHAYPRQGSGVLSSAVWGDGLARIPRHERILPGDRVDYLPFAEAFA